MRLARVMKPGAELRFATDDAPYLAWTLERLMAHPAFVWTAARAADWLNATRQTGRRPAMKPRQLHGKPAYLRFVACLIVACFADLNRLYPAPSQTTETDCCVAVARPPRGTRCLALWVS